MTGSLWLGGGKRAQTFISEQKKVNGYTSRTSVKEEKRKGGGDDREECLPTFHIWWLTFQGNPHSFERINYG